MKKLSLRHQKYLLHKGRRQKSRKIRLMVVRRGIATKICEANRIINLNAIRDKQSRLQNNKKRLINKYKKKIICPKLFSLINNPEEVVKFVTLLQKQLNKRASVFIDMSVIEDITQDAIVVLLSIMSEFKRLRVNFNGDFPVNQNCRNKLQESGFFENLFSSQTIKYNNSNNTYLRKHGKMAHGEEAKNVIRISSENIWKNRKRCQGVYRILIELMQNTHAHASLNKKGEENWWLSVNYDEKENKVRFSFFDYGIGVFNSLNNKEENSKFYNIVSRLKSIVNADSNSEVLRLIMDGTMHKTCTGHYYRGKGLPGIKTTLDRDQISNLIIITNDAFGEVYNNKYIPLQNALEGTFLYWELTEFNHNCNG